MQPPKRQRGGFELLLIGVFICKINELIEFYGKTRCSCYYCWLGGKQSVSMRNAPRRQGRERTTRTVLLRRLGYF